MVISLVMNSLKTKSFKTNRKTSIHKINLDVDFEAPVNMVNAFVLLVCAYSSIILVTCLQNIFSLTRLIAWLTDASRRMGTDIRLIYC